MGSTAQRPALRSPARRATARWLPLAAVVPVAVVLGLAAGLDPLLGLTAFLALMAVAAFVRDGSVAVCAFAAATYFDLAGAYTGTGLTPTKLAGGALVAVAALALLVRARPRHETAGSGSVDDLLGGRGPAWRSHPLLVSLLVAFVAWAALSFAWATNLEQVRSLSTRLLTDALIFLAVPVFLQQVRHVRSLCWTMLASGTVATIVGWALGAAMLGRALGTFSDPNEYAAALVPAIAAGIAVAETSPGSRHRWAGRGMAAICVVGLLGSGSRGGMLALLVAFAVLLLTARGMERVRMSGVLMLALAIGAAWLALTPTGGTVAERILDRDSSGRTDLWKVALRQFQDEPVHGVGLGNYPALSRHYLEGDVENLELFLREPRVVHSTPLELLAELGAVGAALYYGFVGGCLLLGRRAVRIARLSGSAAAAGAARGVYAATWAAITTTLFLSGQYQEIGWVLLATCVAMCAIVQRDRARIDASRTLDAEPEPAQLTS